MTARLSQLGWPCCSASVRQRRIFRECTMNQRKRKHGPGARRGARQGGVSRPGSGAISLRQVEGIPDAFELVHPRCVAEAELDYQEGLELWKAGDPEEARDALRYALGACRDNLWVHVTLGKIALREFKDPALARGHFGYAFEL